VQPGAQTLQLYDLARPTAIDPAGADHMTARRPERGYPPPDFLVEFSLVHRRSPESVLVSSLRGSEASGAAHGDCLRVLPELPTGSVDFVLTDPPYLTRSQSRDGRTVTNDDNDRWFSTAFPEPYPGRLEQNPKSCILPRQGARVLITMAIVSVRVSTAGWARFPQGLLSLLRPLWYRHGNDPDPAQLFC
jgi:hypothetical protein